MVTVSAEWYAYLYKVIRAINLRGNFKSPDL